MIQRQGIAVVEDAQVVVGVTGQADNVAHGQQGAATRQPFTGDGFEVFQGGRTRRSMPVTRCAGRVSAEPSIARSTACNAVVLALCGTAGVALDGLLRW